MNIEYLKSVIIPQREKEIKEGKNLGTRNPIYVVLEAKEHFINDHDNEFSLPYSESGKYPEFGYVDMAVEPEDREFKLEQTNMTSPKPVTRFWTDQVTAFFLTRKAADEYLQYQAHNLNNAFVFVYYIGYGNVELETLFGNE